MKKYFLASITLSLAIALGSIVVVSAQSERELSDQEVQYLTQSCTVSQGNIQSVQRADLATRINRVREYQIMLTLMNNFNARTIQNDIDATDAVLVAASAREKINKFSVDFTQYDAAVKSATSINCSEQPFTYFDLVKDVRKQRTQLKDDVAAINSDLKSFSEAVDVIADAIEASE